MSQELTTTLDRKARPPRNSLERVEAPRFPMDEYREQIVETVQDNSSTVIIGETGSGKTTRVPDFLLDAFPEAKIAITQPRRIAARSVAQYVASQRGESVGKEGAIGYQVRFDDATTEGTRATFMTDGILLQKLHTDPLIQGYDIVMVDEAHERSLNIDLALGLLRRAQAERKRRGLKELKILVASATIEKEKFRNYFDASPAIEVPGRMHPVEVQYAQSEIEDYPKAAAEKVGEITNRGSEGDILIFMPGEEEIRQTIKKIAEIGIENVDVMPLYGAMGPEDQDRIFRSSSKRKVIVATNIAETSVTIDGIRHVIDSGLIKQKEYDPLRGIESLAARRHAKSGCEQRKGRAGRTAPGTCYRLYTEDEYRERPEFQTPEIKRLNLDHVVLAMKKMGIDDITGFDFIDPPERESVGKAIEMLTTLGALDAGQSLTRTGEVMANLPLKPEYARMVIEAQKYGCVESVCTIAAMIGEKSVFVRPHDKEDDADNAHRVFRQASSDFLTMLEVWKEWEQSGFSATWAREHFLNVRQLFEAREARNQLFRALQRQRITLSGAPAEELGIQKSIAAGMIHTLLESSGRYAYRRAIGDPGSPVFIHPSSSVFSYGPRFMVGIDTVVTKKPYVRRCHKVDPDWLPDIAPQILVPHALGPGPVAYDPEQDTVFRTTYYSLRGSSQAIANRKERLTNTAEATECFARALAEGVVRMKVVEENRHVVTALANLRNRSGGLVEVPDLLTWYRAQAGGAENASQALYREEELRLDIHQYCPPELLEQINREYPKELHIHGYTVPVVYTYNPITGGGFIRTQEFSATITLPAGTVFKTSADDIPAIGKDGRPTIIYQSEGHSARTIDDLKNSIERFRIANAWASFRRPEPISVVPLPGQPLPGIESMDAEPIEYTQTAQGDPVYAHPGYRYQQVYNYDHQRYDDKFTLEYFADKATADTSSHQATELRSETILKEQRRADREAMADSVRERQERLNQILDVASRSPESGLTYEEEQHLWNLRHRVDRIVTSADSDIRDAVRLLDEIEEYLRERHLARERNLAALPPIRARAETLRETLREITYASYADHGMSYDDYVRLQRLWTMCEDAMNDATPNPQGAREALDEIDTILRTARAKQAEGKFTTNPFAGLDTLSGIRQSAPAEEPSNNPPDTQDGSEIPRSEPKPVERELMTEEIRAELLVRIDEVEFLASFILSQARPGTTTPEKQVSALEKLRNRLKPLADQCASLRREILNAIDTASVRGKLGAIITAINRSGREWARTGVASETWAETYFSHMSRLRKIAREQDVEITDAMLKTIRPGVARLAQSPSANIDDALEYLILEASG